MVYKNLLMIMFLTCFLRASDFDIHKACENNNVSELKKILDCNKQTLWRRDANGKTPLDIVVENAKSVDVLKVLFEYGASSVQAGSQLCSLNFVNRILMPHVIQYDKTLCHDNFYKASCDHMQFCIKMSTHLFKYRHFIYDHDIVLFFLLYKPRECELLVKNIKELSDLDPFVQSNLFSGMRCFDQIIICASDDVFYKYVLHVYTQLIKPLYKDIYCGREFIAGVCYDILTSVHLSNIQKIQRIIFMLTRDGVIFTDDFACTIFSVLWHCPQKDIIASYITFLIDKKRHQKSGIFFVRVLLKNKFYDEAHMFLNTMVVFDPYALNDAYKSNDTTAINLLNNHFVKYYLMEKYTKWAQQFYVATSY